jgi:trk system potassium uptake protein
MKRFIVIGLGIFGSGVTETLASQGHDVIAIDLNEEKVDRMAAVATRAVVGDAQQLDVLRRIGAEGADAAIVSTGDDISASILVTMALRDLSVAEVYVKTISREHARVMRRLGVTETVFPERESAINLATRIAQGETLLKYLRLGEGFSLQEMVVPDDWEGKGLRELHLRARYNITVIAIHDVLTGQIHPVPDPDAPLKDSDTLLIVGSDKALARVAKLK